MSARRERRRTRSHVVARASSFNLVRTKEHSRIFLGLLIAALALVAPCSAWAIDGAALSKGKDGYWRLVMPSEISQSMRDSVPGFESATDADYASTVRSKYPYDEHQSPFALIADLNRDGREDIVLDGREGKDRVVYVAISEDHTYRWYLAFKETILQSPRTDGLLWDGAFNPPGTVGQKDERSFHVFWPDFEGTATYCRWSNEHREVLIGVAIRCFPMGRTK